MSPQELAELRRLCEAATPGPWTSSLRGKPEAEGWELGAHVQGGQYPIANCHSGYNKNGYGHHIDSVFIATSREAIPKLLDEVERLQLVAKFPQSQIEADLKKENQTLRDLLHVARDLVWFLWGIPGHNKGLECSKFTKYSDEALGEKK